MLTVGCRILVRCFHSSGSFSMADTLSRLHDQHVPVIVPSASISILCLSSSLPQFQQWYDRTEQFADGNADWRSRRVRAVLVRAIAQSFGCFFSCMSRVTSEPQSLQWMCWFPGWPRQYWSSSTEPHTIQTPFGYFTPASEPAGAANSPGLHSSCISLQSLSICLTR